MSQAPQDCIDTLIDAFESEWRSQRRPDIAAFLERTAEAERPALLRELVRLDLEYRLRAGEPARVEECLSQFPALQAERNDTLELIGLEYRVRLDCGERVGVAEYLERFPALRDTLPAKLGPLGRGPTEVPGYEILEELGRGGMGVVYRAHDVEFGRTVAVKIVRGGRTPREEVEGRFLDEAQITARLQHPGIPPVHRLGKLPSGESFLAMKLIEGRTFLSRLAERTDPSAALPELLRDFEQVCQTVAYAHRQGAVHRDLKPANIMVGAFGEVQVMDWGLAKWIDGPSAEPGPADVPVESTTATQAGAILGTPAYMPPEQARGERVDARADVFALGAILCEVLTGLPPYAGLDDVFNAARNGNLETARQRLRACGARDLAALAERCLARDPAERPGVASIVATALAQHREGVEQRLRAVERQRAVEQAKAAEERKRRRVLLAASALAALLLTAGIVGTSVGLWRAGKELARAESAERASQARLAASYVDTGRLHLQQGRWREALASFAAAVEAGHPDSAALGLYRLRAQNALSDFKGVTDEVEALARRDDLDEEQQALLQLWRGDIILARRGKQEEAIHCVQEALKQKLPPAETAYARGLLAETSPEAVRFFRQALEADPLHHRAHYHLIFLLVLLGRQTEAHTEIRLAETLFPDDPNFVVFRSLLAAGTGDLPAALEAFENVKHRWGDDRRAAQFRLIIEVFHIGSGIEELSAADNDKRMQAADRIMQRANELFKGVEPHAQANDASFPLVLPPLLSRRFGRLTAFVPFASSQLADTWEKLEPQTRQSSFLVAWNSAWTSLRTKGADELAEAARVHPEGTLLYLQGRAARAKERWREAEVAFTAAVDSPALFPIQRMALLEAVEVGWRLADIHGKHSDPEAKQRLVERIHRVTQLLRPGNDPGVTAADLEGLASKAWQCGATHLAHLLLNPWSAREPNSTRCLGLRAKVYFSSAAYASAIEAARAAMKAGPVDPDYLEDLKIILYWSPKHLATQAEMYKPKPLDKNQDEKPRE